MRLYSFFSGSKFLPDSYSYIYCYGNQPTISTFRAAFLRWWYQRKGYQLRLLESLEEMSPEPSLFASHQGDLSFSFLKKPPKSLKDILNRPSKFYWSATHTKSILHQEALNASQVLAIACYEIKPEEMIQALMFYSLHEFNVTLRPQDLKDLAIYLCQEPPIFFSEVFKLALGASQPFLPPLREKEDLIGSLRFQSAVTLKNLGPRPSASVWVKLMALRHQEIVLKSGSLASQALLDYYYLQSL